MAPLSCRSGGRPAAGLPASWWLLNENFLPNIRQQTALRKPLHGRVDPNPTGGWA